MPEDLGSRYKSPALAFSYKSQKIWSSELKYFLSYCKKTMGGQIDPPSRVNRVKITLTIFPFLFQIKKVEIDHKHIRALKETLNVKKDAMPDMYQVIPINLTKIVLILYHLNVNFAGKIDFLGENSESEHLHRIRFNQGKSIYVEDIVIFLAWKLFNSDDFLFFFLTFKRKKPIQNS